jgi:hypothetical protein
MVRPSSTPYHSSTQGPNRLGHLQLSLFHDIPRKELPNGSAGTTESMLFARHLRRKFPGREKEEATYLSRESYPMACVGRGAQALDVLAVGRDPLGRRELGIPWISPEAVVHEEDWPLRALSP